MKNFKTLITAIFALFDFTVEPVKKDASCYAVAREKKLSLFIKLKEELSEDNKEILSAIWEREEEIEAVKAAIENLKKSIDDLEVIKIENENTIFQIAKFV
jgi:hypothetical protein